MMAYVDQVTFMNPTVDLIAFPELCLNGIEPINWRQMAEPIPGGPSTKALTEKAKAMKKWIAPGSYFELGDDGNVYNTPASAQVVPTDPSVKTFAVSSIHNRKSLRHSQGSFHSRTGCACLL
ncbi:nitrilase-related carbon-nitrogen hydrolase [Bacillus sp. OxB-1]|uniref:nitrilase-related carbon-nitrogen hydrolase n=1 Tax=Bacillus sp. (strain OxB-1) TaxID=98228 RepID=UPI0011859750